MQELQIAPSTTVSQYQVPYAKPGKVRILPARPKARPYDQPSYPTEKPDKWFGKRGALNRNHYAAAPLQKRHKGAVQNDRMNQEIEERIQRQLQQVRVERPAPTGLWPVDQSQEVGNFRSVLFPSPAATEGSDQDIITVSPDSRNHYNFLDGVYTKYRMDESVDWVTRHSAYALQMGNKDIIPFPPLTNAVALPIVQDLFLFPPLTQELLPVLVPLQDYEDAISVDAVPASQTPLPARDDLMYQLRN